MTPQEAYDTAKEVTEQHLVFEGEVAPEEDARSFIIGEAAAWLADLSYDSDVRRAALRGLVAAQSAINLNLFLDEEMLARAVAEELNTAL